MSKEPQKTNATAAPEFGCWKAMLNRCRNPRGQDYRHYGGRGITVCPEWLDFHRFRADMGPRPSPKHTIERIDVNGNYEPSNCCWMEWSRQNSNTRRNRLLEYQGRCQSVTAWARELGVPYMRLISRLNMGWSIERTLGAPRQRRQLVPAEIPEYQYSPVLIGDREVSIKEAARILGVKYPTLYQRLRRGWSCEEAISTPMCRSDRRGQNTPPD